MKTRLTRSKYKISISFVLLFLFLITDYGHAEEFVSYSQNNSQFKISMPDMFPENLNKINNNEVLNNNTIQNVSSFEELSAALDKAKGGEIIVVRRNLRGKRFHYRQKHPFKKTVLVLGMLENNKAPYLDNITWENLHNVTLSHFKINNRKAESRYTYSWQLRNSGNIRLTNLHFMGNYNNLTALKSNNIGAILHNPSGLLIKNSTDILIDRTLFTDLFHCVEFTGIDSFYAVANKSVRISSDMFSGGGLTNSLFDSNLSLERIPVYYKRWNKMNYVHSDMIQLYTTKTGISNSNITIRNNISLPGNVPLTHPQLAGWQCFFTRDERGDSPRYRSLPYTNINIINNICALNQHHGVTMARGHNSVVAGNLILLLDKGKTKREATGAIKVFQNSNCRILGNVAKVFDLRGLSNCKVVNNIYDYKPNFQKTLSEIKQGISSAGKRDIIPPLGTTIDLSRYYGKKDLVNNPLQFLDYSSFTFVPSF